MRDAESLQGHVGHSSFGGYREGLVRFKEVQHGPPGSISRGQMRQSVMGLL